MWVTFADLTDGQSPILDGLQKWLGHHGLNIAVILIGAWLLRQFGAALVTRLIKRTIRRDMYPTELDRKRRVDTLDSLIVTVMRIGVGLIAVIMIVDELGINTAPLLASAGVLGLALGFGAQSMIKDFVSGVFIIVENQYRVGDIVQLGDVDGKVEAITIRTTVLRDLDGNLHHIPNGTITLTTNKTIDFGNLNEDITVDKNTDIELLEHIVNHIGDEMKSSPVYENYIKSAPRFDRVKGFSEHGVVVKITGRCTAGDQWKVKSELYKRLQKEFKKHKIELSK